LPKLRNNYLNIIKTLYLYQEKRNISITYKLNEKYIYIIFDEDNIKENKKTNVINNRILSIDLNPNYIGLSICDWEDENKFKVIYNEICSIKKLNDKEILFKQFKLNSADPKRVKINNKRKFEILQISKKIINLCLSFNVELFVIEKLNIKSKDNEKGKNFNRLVNNNWNRNILINNLEKRCKLYGIKYIEVNPEYSSFIGNFLFRSLNFPDPILSSIEIGRRGYEFNIQYIKKIKAKKKNIIFPDVSLYKDFYFRSLEEFKINIEHNNWLKLYYFIKKSKIKYRLSFDNLNYKQKFSSQKHKNLIEFYIY
jgi:IS605 OrfB family transposase